MPKFLNYHSLSKKQIIFFVLSLLIVLIASATISYSYLSKTNNDQELTEVEENLSPVKIDDHEVDLSKKTTLTVLLLGYGGPGHQGGFLADAIQLVHFDFEKDQISMISIPRDLWVKLPGGSQAKINQSLSMGADSSNLVMSGGKVSKKMAEVVTGIEVDYFIAADFVGFKRTVGGPLGSIEVDVPETLEDKWYPIAGEELNTCGKSPEEVAKLSAELSGFELEKQFECRYEHLYFPQGINKMEGGDALAYVRSRHGSASGDFSRSQRQHALLRAVRDKLFKLEFWQETPELYSEISKNVTSDIDLEAVEYLLPVLKLVNNYQLNEGVISTENVLSSSKSSAGAFILVPKTGLDNWTEVHDYVQQVVNEE